MLATLARWPKTRAGAIAGVVTAALVGCAGPLRSAALAPGLGRELFPGGAFDPSATSSPRTCNGDFSRFSEQRAAVRRGPPPVPGDDDEPTLLLLEDQLTLHELVAIELIQAVYGPSYFSGYETVFVATPPDDDPHVIFVSLGGDAKLEARVLLRARVQGGLFDHLSYCEVRSFQVSAPHDGRVRRLVLRDLPSVDGASPTLYVDPPGIVDVPASFDGDF